LEKILGENKQKTLMAIKKSKLLAKENSRKFQCFLVFLAIFITLYRNQWLSSSLT